MTSVVSSDDTVTNRLLTHPQANDMACPDHAKVLDARLSNFRCHDRFELATTATNIVLHGPNGAGKTSIFEGFSLLTSSKGIRNATSDDMWRRAGPASAQAWSVSATIENGLHVSKAKVGWSKDVDASARSRKQLMLDGKVAGSCSELAKSFQFIWLTPEMDRVFAESAVKRRRLLDRLVCLFDPSHATRLNAYDRTLQQRSRLLKLDAWDLSWLSVLEEKIVANGIAITAARHETAERLQEAARESTHIFPAFFLRFDGDVDGWIADQPSLEAEDRYRQSLVYARKRDSEIGGAGIGPHRSTFYVYLTSSKRRAEDCSMGEQKALIVSFVLASVRLQKIHRKMSPILLLDDIAAHLDRDRRDGLFDAVCSLRVQAWYTGTDVSVFGPLRGSADYCRVG